MKFELYKIFKKKIVLIFIGVGLLWLSISILLPVLQYRTFTEQMEPLTGIEAIHYDRDLQNLYAGQYTADEFAPLYAEYKKYIIIQTTSVQTMGMGIPFLYRIKTLLH